MNFLLFLLRGVVSGSHELYLKAKFNFPWKFKIEMLCDRTPQNRSCSICLTGCRCLDTWFKRDYFVVCFVFFFQFGTTPNSIKNEDHVLH